MIRIEFPSDRPDIAQAIGRALTSIRDPYDVVEEDKPCAGSCGANALTQEADPDVARTDHIEATIPVSQGGHMADPEEKQIPSNMFPGETTGAGESTEDVDNNGVQFNGMFCGKAAKPFYETGKRTGQWKKRKGVEDSVYDNWYAEQLGNTQGVASAANATPGEDTTPDVAGAFIPPGQEQTAPAADAPTTPGLLMAWVSEQQTAGKLTAQDVQDAYTAAGCSVPDLFGPNGASFVPTIHSNLLAKVSA